MGMKLKSGADLCGFQLTNFCVQGEASAPSDAALGRKYFHTNATDDVATGISLLNRERIYLGEGAWRATAYLDDIAAINEKLNLITGDTDTDTLINNLKDLEEFLKDFSETDKLKSLLDGKLDKSGGTIKGSTIAPLEINTTTDASYIKFLVSGGLKAQVGWSGSGAQLIEHTSGKSIGVKTDGTPFYNDGTVRTLIHSGNIGNQKVAAAKTLIDDNDVQLFATYTNTSSLLLGVVSHHAYIDGKTVTFRYGSSYATAMLINSSGNVTIGDSDLAGTSAKLYVEGKMRVTSRLLTGDGDDAGIWRGSHFSSGLAVNDIAIYGENKIVLYGGNVLIGTSSEIKSGVKLQVRGDLYVDGNIIATKEVSAGGAGAEESTSGGGSAEGVSEIFTPTSTSMAFDHNLGEDVIVQVYEKSGNVWNMVIVDTEITSATRVTLRFGKIENTEHKVVIMGV